MLIEPFNNCVVSKCMIFQSSSKKVVERRDVSDQQHNELPILDGVTARHFMSKDPSDNRTIILVKDSNRINIAIALVKTHIRHITQLLKQAHLMLQFRSRKVTLLIKHRSVCLTQLNTREYQVDNSEHCSILSFKCALLSKTTSQHFNQLLLLFLL